MFSRVYEEEFSINNKLWYAIQKIKKHPSMDTAYRLSCNSQIIFESPILQECRIVAHNHAKSHFKRLCEEHVQSLEMLYGFIKQLGDSPEGLDNFKLNKASLWKSEEE